MSNQVKFKDLEPAFNKMLECGLSKEKATQEIGFAIDQINKKDSLSKASVKLLNQVVVQVAYTGLSLNYIKQEAVISDYNERGQRGVFFMPMFRGLTKVAISEGAIVAANAQVIRDGDEYEINAASFKNPVRHIVKSFSKDSTVLVTYCVLLLPSGVETVTVFREDEYQYLKGKAKNQKSDSPHNVWTDEMRKKSCLKRALKSASSTRDSKLDHLITLDNLQYNLEPVNGTEAPPKEETKNGKPILTVDNEKINGIIKALATGVHNWETIREHMTVSQEVEKQINLQVEKLKSNATTTV